MTLSIHLLENVQTKHGKTTARCPACKEQGHDKSGDHLLIATDGRYGCAVDKSPEHSKRIFALAGDKDSPRQAGRQSTTKATVSASPTKPTGGGWETAEAAAAKLKPDGHRLAGVIYYNDNTKAEIRYEADTDTKDIGKPKKQFRVIHKKGGAWFIGEGDGKWALRGKPQSDSTNCIFEGAKCADAAGGIGLTSINSAMGASNAAKSDWTPLAGAEIAIFPDNDTAGEKYAADVARILTNLAPPARVRIVRLPNLPASGDIADWIEARDAIEPEALKAEIERMMADAPEMNGEGLDTFQIISLRDFLSEPLPKPRQIIREVLGESQVGMLAASAKAGKSFALQAACLCVSIGKDWMGWATTQGDTLYINGELPPYDLQTRPKCLAEALGIGEVPGNVDVWHLRGQRKTIRALLPQLLRRQDERGKPYSLIVPDPLYYFNGDRDENDNTAQAETMGELAELAERTGAAVLVAHHFSKGNKSLAEHLDRASGAGMFARAVDTFITLTAHEEPDCYTVETTCRSFAKPRKFVVRWDYPLWRVDEELDPDRLRPHPGAGRTPRFTPEGLVDLLPGDGLNHKDWLAAAQRELKIGRSRFNELIHMAKSTGLVVSAFGLYTPAGRYAP